MKLISEQLTAALKNLPGEAAHLMMFPKRKGASVVKKEQKNFKKAGVLLLVNLKNEKFPTITLTERQSYKGAHSGQISFPGGKMEETDRNLMDTALRETEEEIGVTPHQINVLGELTELYIPVSNFLVQPFVAITNESLNYIPEEKEVKQIIDFPIIELLKEDAIIPTSVKAGETLTLKNIPAFIYQEKIIWGATALILNEFRIILKEHNVLNF